MNKTNAGHILVVDDDQAICDVLKASLELSNFKVSTCGSVAEANNLISMESFVTVLIDIYLPDMDGTEFIAQLNEQGFKTPIIIITGSSELEMARKAIRLSVYDYLIKPFKQKHLQQIVHNAVMKYKLIEEQADLEGQRLLYQNELEKMVQKKIYELRESESKYRGLLEQTLVGVFIQQNGSFRYVNQKTCSILECKSEVSIYDKSLEDFLHEDDKALVREHFESCSKGNVVQKSISFRIQTEKKIERVLEMWVDAVTFQNESALEGVIVDITERQQLKNRERQLELQLLNEHKLAAIGRLTAGLSHNLNTPISIIQGNMELLQLKQPDLSEIDIILRQTTKMSEIIQTVARKGQVEQNNDPVELDLNKLLADELSFLEANLFYKHRVQKDFNFQEPLPFIKGLYSDFSQSLLQIIQNAIDAMYESEKRILSITTRSDTKQIIVEIRDTGKGITPEEQKKIFLPFFTTKPVQVDSKKDPDAPRGTGLGLSMAKNSLSPYGAEIDFESTVNIGTLFTIKIPLN